MRKFVFAWALLALFLLQVRAEVNLDQFLNRREVVEFRVIGRETIYDSIVEVMIQQPLDHRDPEGESFAQRLYISHIDPLKPVVFVTAGYDAGYYYTSEIASRLQCNQIMVEHRYFGKSRPDSLQWQYLDTWQAASDHHRIVSIFSELYPGKWISTGISKGGQTVMYHSMYYPDDVDVRVPYVAPLNFSVEDERIYLFLDRVGSAAERRKVSRFQKMALKRQERYLPVFIDFSRDKGYSYEVAGGFEKAYEYCVLEYSFAFWQWGYVPADEIPGRNAEPAEVIEHMNEVAGFDYFSDRFITQYRPFFYQALTEMGYYGYDLEEFERFIRHVDNPVFTFTLPEGIEYSYNEEVSRNLQQYLSREAENFIFIYGEYDTWSATAVNPETVNGSVFFVKEGGNHRTRINNMPEEQKRQVYETLATYLAQP
ncbi:MAG: S28 family serine protease [Bacteroidales bacterium]